MGHDSNFRQNENQEVEVPLMALRKETTLGFNSHVGVKDHALDRVPTEMRIRLLVSLGDLEAPTAETRSRREGLGQINLIVMILHLGPDQWLPVEMTGLDTRTLLPNHQGDYPSGKLTILEGPAEEILSNLVNQFSPVI